MTRQAAMAETIAGRYHVIARIASGGMGEVFRARDTVLGRIVAVKVLPAALATRAGFVERFRAEAQAAASLSHPNVVQVHDWGDTGELSYMVMEYVRGRNLREILAGYRRLAPWQACEIVIQALRALGAAHERGLVHRDVKPENILVTLDGIVKVADFGLARGAEGAATTGELVGTVAYVAPEQVRGDPVDGRTDLYAMGCVLYELLTGSQPHEGDPARVLHEHLHGQVPAPSREQPDVGEELDRIVARATATDPTQRYASAAQMLAALEGALAGVSGAPPISELTQELTSEVPPEIQETMVPARRRKPRVGRVLLALLAVAGLGVLGYLFRPVRVPDVIGAQRGQARRTLNLAGLAVDVRDAASNERKDSVVDTSPDAGKLVRHGQKVVVTVSRGPVKVTVPAVGGLPLAEATAALERQGLSPGGVNRHHAPSDRDKVLSQAPAPGGTVLRGSLVDLEVSDGPEYVDLPAWVGRPFAEVEQARPGLGVAVQRTEVWGDAPSGTVLAQDPAGGPGRKVVKGSTVTVTTSKGPEPFAIPDYTGQGCAAAKADLESRGIAVTVNGGGDCATRKVIDQYPPGGVPVKKGSAVTLYI